MYMYFKAGKCVSVSLMAAVEGSYPRVHVHSCTLAHMWQLCLAASNFVFDNPVFPFGCTMYPPTNIRTISASEKMSKLLQAKKLSMYILTNFLL
jgi:hypothetical protein